jgi:hypothetical protein
MDVAQITHILGQVVSNLDTDTPPSEGTSSEDIATLVDDSIRSMAQSVTEQGHKLPSHIIWVNPAVVNSGEGE